MIVISAIVENIWNQDIDHVVFTLAEVNFNWNISRISMSRIILTFGWLMQTLVSNVFNIVFILTYKR